MFREAAQARLTGQEEIARNAVLAYLDSYRTGDIEARVALFAEDASFEDPVGSPPILGHDALRAFWQAGAGFTVDMNLEALCANLNEAVYLFTARVSQGDDAVLVRTFETLVVDQTGKITAMRAYFDQDMIS